MSPRNVIAGWGRVVLGALLCASFASAGTAQPPRGPMGPGGPMMGFRPMPVNPAKVITAVELPLPQLNQALNLTDDQRTTIGGIQRDFQQAMRKLLMPPGFEAPAPGMDGQPFNPDGPPPQPGQGPPPPGGFAPQGPDGMPGAPGMMPPMGPGMMPPGAPMGPPPDRETLENVRTLERQASDKINGVLNADQKAKLTRLLADINDFNMVGFPPEAATLLNLTPDQRRKIAAIAAQARKTVAPSDQQKPGSPYMPRVVRRAHNDALDVLTPEQEARFDQWVQNRPGPMPGGMMPGGMQGGFGPGGRQGGFGPGGRQRGFGPGGQQGRFGPRGRQGGMPGGPGGPPPDGGFGPGPDGGFAPPPGGPGAPPPDGGPVGPPPGDGPGGPPEE